MGWDPSSGLNPSTNVENPFEGGWKGDAQRAIPKAASGNPNDWFSGWGSNWGSPHNPFKGGGASTPGVYTPPPINAPNDVQAPTFDPSQFQFTPGTNQGPASFTGAQIRPVADPRQVLIDPTQQAQFRRQQQGLISQLSDQAAGRGPSIAQQQLLQAQQANQSAAFAQMASARGQGNPAIARQALMSSSNLQAQTSRDAAVARMQEQMNAQQTLGSTLAGARQQDIGMATSQAQLTQEANLTEYKGKLQLAVEQGHMDQSTAELMYKAAQDRATQNLQVSTQMQMQYNDARAKYAQMGMSAAQANQLAALDVQRMTQDSSKAAYQSQIEIAKLKQQAKANMLAGISGGLGTAATLIGGMKGLGSSGSGAAEGASAGGTAAETADTGYAGADAAETAGDFGSMA